MRRWVMAAMIAGAAAAGGGCGFPEPTTPLSRAAMEGDDAAVRSLLAGGADPNAPEGHGLTPLVLAARFGRVEAARLLLAAGADANRPDRIRTRSGWTPLMNAAHKNRKGTIRVLLEAGAAVDAQASDGTTALMLAAPDADTEIVRMLLEAGADPRRGRGGSAALTSAVAMGRADTVKALIDSAPDLVLERGVRGWLARLLARARGEGRILEMLDRERGRRANPAPGTAPPAPAGGKEVRGAHA